MKKLLLTTLFVAGLFSAHAVLAQTSPASAAEMEACFRMHGHLMDKPSLKNERACWRVHAYLMERR